MIKQGVSKIQILSKIDEIYIFKKYAPTFELNKKFKGDILRTKDEKLPSANIFYSQSGLIYHDFGLGLTLNAFSYVESKFNLTYKEALEKIDDDFNLGFGYNSRTSKRKTYRKYKLKDNIPRKEKVRRIIKIKTSKWSELDLLYWESNGWNQSMLDKAKIKPIDAYFINYGDGELIRYDVKNELAYSYDYYTDLDGIFQRKIYIPNRTSGKWLSNVNNQTTQLWHLLPKKGNICFITSSLKDCGPISKIYKQWCAIAPNNEGSFITNNVFNKIRKRYKQIVILYDNDEAGILNAKKYSNKYNIPYIHSPMKNYKDPSELYQAVGVNRFYQIIKQELINNNIKHYL